MTSLNIRNAKRKTRNVKGKDAPDAGEGIPLAQCADPWTCPVHDLKVQVIPRRSITASERDDSGTQGAFYGCPKYGECGYYISSNLKKAYRSRVIAKN